MPAGASSVLFVICVLGYHGIHPEDDDEFNSSYTVIDDEAAAAAVQSGRYFGQFLVYVCVSYLAMLVEFWKRHA